MIDGIGNGDEWGDVVADDLDGGGRRPPERVGAGNGDRFGPGLEGNVPEEEASL